MRLIPALRAAIVFSLIPPTGRTFPVSDISPVIARSFLIDFPIASDSIDVAIVTPAEGPSFGVAPSGTCLRKNEFNK